MSYFVRRWWGPTVRELPETQFADVLAELADADEEHGSVSLTHESGWVLAYNRGRRLILEQLDSDDTLDRFHITDAAPELVLILWSLLSRGLLPDVKAAAWQSGYGE